MAILYYLIFGLYQLIGIYSWVLVIYALMSWLPAVGQSRFGYMIYQIVRPYLSLFDKIPTRFGVFDFQVVLGYVVLLGVQRLLLIAYLHV